MQREQKQDKWAIEIRSISESAARGEPNNTKLHAGQEKFR